MEQFDTSVSAPKWEFGYWGSTIDNWYDQGLPQKQYPVIPEKITTPTASLYTPCWRSIKGGKLPAGIAVLGGGLYYPSQGFAKDYDVMNAMQMDWGQRLIDINLLFDPMFEVKILEEDDEYLTYVDLDGVTRRFIKSTGVIPSLYEPIITDRNDWEKLKRERINMHDLSSRFPEHWDQLVEEYNNRDYPLVLMGYPQGYFGSLAQLMGYEHLFYSYYDNPELIHDINKTFTELWIAMFEEVLAQTSVDMVIIWEDISAGKGSMVSPDLIREFMSPYYRKLTSFLKAKGINTIFIDTDGECHDLIPIFMEAGITGMYPIEASCGMDIVRVRKDFPDLKLMGGIPKSEIKFGKERIDEILEPVKQVYKQGGYIPFGDHLIPPDVPWKEFTYYREKLNNILDHKE
jgi:uroporphyrinogen decarboxylase